MAQVIYVNELYHHGVKGMKWGHRKSYKQLSDYHASKMGTSKTAVGRYYHNQRAMANDVKNLSNKQYKSDKTVLQRAGTLFGGSGYATTRHQAQANYYNRKAKYSKTEGGKKETSEEHIMLNSGQTPLKNCTIQKH